MSVYQKKCKYCGELCKPVDKYRPFGSKSFDPLEPYDMKFICEDCYPQFVDYVRRMVKDRHGHWVKSDAEKKIAEALKLKWVGSGMGILMSEVKWEDQHRYITKSRYKKLEELPYWGYCRVCGSICENSYCPNKNCEGSSDNFCVICGSPWRDGHCTNPECEKSLYARL